MTIGVHSQNFKMVFSKHDICKQSLSMNLHDMLAIGQISDVVFVMS